MNTDLYFHSQSDKELVTFTLSHFCFITLRANGHGSREAAERTGYCVCPLLPSPKDVNSGTFTYHLCVTYFMDP